MRRGQKIPLSKLRGETVRCPRCGELGKEKRYCDVPLNRGKPPAVVVDHEVIYRGPWVIETTKQCAFKTLEEYEVV